MPEPRAQRTLVKSPPEIWAEISDAGTLARHLGEFGEIRITDLKAETTVVWEGDTARGTVNLEPSGWGTRVTITAEPVAAPVVEEEQAPEAEAEAEPEPVAEPEPEPVADAEPEPEPVADEPELEPVAEAEAEPVAETPVQETPAAAEEPAPAPRKRGFFARLFGRKAAPAPAPVPEAATSVAPPAPKLVAVEEPTSVAPPALAPEPIVAEEPAPIAPPAPAGATVADASPSADDAPAPDAPAVVEPELEGEIVATAAMDAERMEAVLVGVLDDLGSAHHRPFSRG